MNTLRTLRGKRNPTPDHAAGLLAGDVVFDSPALTRGVLGWDTLGGPDPGTFDTLGGPDRRTGEDHPAGPGGQRAPRRHGAHHQLLHPGPAHPGRPAITYPSLLVAHVARFPGTDAAFAGACRPQARPHRPAAAATGRKGAEHE